MSEVNYLIGDATEPQGKGNKIICSVNNSIGGWGAGFVMALSKKWKEPEAEYRSWKHTDDFFFNTPPFKLGEIQLVKVEDNIYVANMIAQHDVRDFNNIPPIRYDRLRQCLNKVAARAVRLNATVHMPNLIGCGLAGGHRATVIGLIEETLIAKDIAVFIYTLLENK